MPWIPDIIWASPPCTEYSRAKARGVRNLELADKLVAKFIEIRDHFLELNPSMLWFCENGETMLWDREVAKTLCPRVHLSYCQYGRPYRKNTIIATNAVWDPAPKKCNPKTCAMIVDGVHLFTAQQGPSRMKGISRKEDVCSRDMLHSIPEQLCEEIYEVCLKIQWEVV